jgi:hypothetical protein
MSMTQNHLLQQQREWSESRFFRPGSRTIDPAPDQTVYFDAGAITIGIESRILTEKMLDEHFAHLAADPPPGMAGVNDGGPSVHVIGTVDRHEYLRFDCFRDGPHYHYMVPGLDGVVVFYFDPVANGAMAKWVVQVLRTRLPEMLSKAGADVLAADVDQERVDAVVDRIAPMLVSL